MDQKAGEEMSTASNGRAADTAIPPDGLSAQQEDYPAVAGPPGGGAWTTYPAVRTRTAAGRGE
jgi:hypothetical protein